MIDSDHIRFSNLHVHYALSFIDIVGSTVLVSKLSGREADLLYTTFLNDLAKIITANGGVIIKTIGDGMIYYFPKTDFGVLEDFEQVLHVGLEVLHERGNINKILAKNNLPEIDYRVSASFGPVSVIEDDDDVIDDLFGTTVNTCAKMNKLAAPNTMIIGSALHQKVEKTKKFTMHEHEKLVLDDHLSYMTYIVDREN